MSHFTVLVLGSEPETQLAPFDEILEFPRYVKHTKEQLIEKGKMEIEDYKNGTYAEYLADPETYEQSTSNENHLKYVKNEFPLKLTFTDEEIYADQIRYYEPEEIGDFGEVYSKCNPKAKWDWFQLGGRWAGTIKLKEGIKGTPPNFSYGWSEEEKQKALNDNVTDQAKKGDIANLSELTTFAVLKAGVWYARGEMGWFGMASNEKPDEQWESELKTLIEGLPDDMLLSIYDCHI